MTRSRPALLGLVLAGALGAARPSGVGEIVFSDPGGQVTVQLRQERCWRHRAIAAPDDPYAHQDPLSTAFRPRLRRQHGAQTCLWTGFRPSAHEAPGDTVVAYSLLLQAPPVGQDGAVTALWHEDHMEVPTLLYTATGSLDGALLSMQLEGGELAEDARVEGVLVR